MPEPASMTLLGVGFTGLVIRFLRGQYRKAKPVLDLLSATLLLVLFSPAIAVTAILIKLTSKGPVFYKQERVGLNGRVFTLIKLRTMHHGAEAKSGPTWAQGDYEDPRVTPIGRILRKTHLDEIPQLVNVLRGEMSLIGPRPERPYFVNLFAEEIPEYAKRLAVKPGITGLAQVRAGYGRTIRDVKRKVRLDLVYIRRLCWWVDLSIALATLPRFVSFVRSGRRKTGTQKNSRAVAAHVRE